MDHYIKSLVDGQSLPLKDVKLICEIAKQMLLEESNVQPVSAPVFICGDIHGQFYDLLQLFKTAGGMPPNANFIFMGDYVDRGKNSVETIELLLCLKIRYPDKITILRGNHESRQISQLFGFYQECLLKYHSIEAWTMLIEVFDYLSIAALVENRFFCVHGGLSPSIKTLDQIRVIERFQEIPQDGAFCDLLWSDPDEVGTWAPNTRGAGYLFGHKVSAQYNYINGLDLICRAHQLVNEGFNYYFPEHSVLTVWSAPNYCYRCGNLASILLIDSQLNREFRIFREDDSQENISYY